MATDATETLIGSTWRRRVLCWLGRGAAARPAQQAIADAVATAGLADADQQPPAASLWRVRTTLMDRPGRLAAVCANLAGLDVNILTVQVHQLADAVIDEFLVAAPEHVTPDHLVEAVTAAGGSDVRAETADAHDLVDVPTRVLTLAARAAADTAELPFVLRDLFGDCVVRWLPDNEGGDSERVDTELRLPDPDCGELVITRADVPFTPAEAARARALVDLFARLARQTPTDQWSVLLPDGSEVTVRRADRTDLDAVVRTHQRCSPPTLRRRYSGGLADVPRRQLDHLLGARFAYTLVAEARTGEIVAMGNLIWDGRLAELALLVEDGWQGQRLGTVLVRRLMAFAGDAGIDGVYALTQPDNAGMIQLMRRCGSPMSQQLDKGTLTITAHFRA